MVCNPCTRHCIFHWLALFNTTDYDRIQSYCDLYEFDKANDIAKTHAVGLKVPPIFPAMPILRY